MGGYGPVTRIPCHVVCVVAVTIASPNSVHDHQASCTLAHCRRLHKVHLRATPRNPQLVSGRTLAPAGVRRVRWLVPARDTHAPHALLFGLLLSAERERQRELDQGLPADNCLYVTPRDPRSTLDMAVAAGTQEGGVSPLLAKSPLCSATRMRRCPRLGPWCFLGRGILN
jgi:hypothetical protein